MKQLFGLLLSLAVIPEIKSNPAPGVLAGIQNEDDMTIHKGWG